MSYSTRKARAWQEALFAALLFLALTLVFFWQQLVERKILYWGDIGLYFTPMTGFLRSQLLGGHIPLWNPWILCGTPFLGNPQAWPLYPATLLLPYVSAPGFLSLTVALHVWLAAFGAFLFLRRAESRTLTASLLGAVVFAYGGQLVSKEQFPNMVQAIAWMPLILHAVHRLTRRWQVMDALWLGFLLALQILAAHAQMTLLTLYLAVIYGSLRLISHRPPLSTLAARLAAIAFVAVGLSAAQTLPVMELYRDAFRQKLTFSIVNRFYLPPNQLGNFVLPALHGHPFYGTFTARGNFWETCCYIGVPAFALACAGGYFAWRRRSAVPARFWTIVFVVGVWMATGGAGGLYHAAYLCLPGFRSFHDPARCLLWSVWAASMLVAAGWQELTKGVKPRSAAVLFVVAIVAIFADLAHFSRTLYPLEPPDAANVRPAELESIRQDSAFAAHQARILAPDSARVWQRFTGHRGYRQNAPGYQQTWTDTLTPNLAMRLPVPDAYGYEPFTRRDAQVITGSAARAFRPEATDAERQSAAALAGMLGVKKLSFLRVVSPSATIPGISLLSTSPTLPPLSPGADASHIFFAENLKWRPRARLTTNWISAPSRAAATAMLLDAKNTAPQSGSPPTIVVGMPAVTQDLARLDIPAEIVEDAPDRVTITCRAPTPCLLVLSDAMHPGWRAQVDNHPAPIFSANGFLRAVPLPAAGSHTITFEYSPASFIVGLYFTLVTLTCLMGWGTSHILRDFRTSRAFS